MAHISSIQFYRGAAAGLPVLADGEPGWTTDTFELFVGQGGVNRPLGTGSGSVTSVATGSGLTGGPITTTGTLSLADFLGLTAAVLADGDMFPFSDVSAAANRRVSAADVRDYACQFGHLAAGGPLAADDRIPYQDTSLGGPRYLTPAQLAAFLLPAGLIYASATGVAPTGWLPCDGAAVSRTTFADLWNAIGVIWGGGNGTTTFNVPDLRGRTIVGTGSGAGLTPRSLTESSGTETVQLVESELPIHQHEVRSANGTVLFEIGTGAVANIINSATFAGSLAVYKTQATGAGGFHPNMQPFKGLLWCIKT